MANRPKFKKKIIQVSAKKGLFGRPSEMEKTIEKWGGLGWELKKQSKVRGKERYILTFEYEMSGEEIALQKKQQRYAGFGCLALFIAVVVIGTIGSNQQKASIAATKTYQGTEIAYANATAEKQAEYDTATATLWTPTFTPTPSNTPTNTSTPTITYTPSTTFTPSITPTVTPSATITDTPIPTTITPTDAPVVTYYIRASANARTCEQITCDIAEKLPAGTVVQGVGTSNGQEVLGSTLWVRISYNGRVMYVHSSLVSESPPATAAPARVNQPAQQPVQQVSQPTLDHPAGATAKCGDGSYSYAAHHQGACSHHDGVVVFYK